MAPSLFFQSAVQLHRAGKLAEAEQAYRQTLAADPNHCDALHLMGVICAQRGQHTAAQQLIRRAIAIRPDVPEFYMNLGNSMVQSGETAQAIACYRQHLALRPNNDAVLHQLSLLLAQQNDLVAAVDFEKRALALKPDDATYREFLARLFIQSNRHDLAAIEFREATVRFPREVKFWHNLACALAESGKTDEALETFDQALKIDPRVAAVHCNRAVALRALGRHDEALGAARKALELDPNCPGGHTILGALYGDVGDLEPSRAAYERALQQEPNEAGNHWNLALVLLRLGDFERGWAEFEWRLKYPGLRLNRGFPQAQWDGSDPSGKTILLHTEGGFGDALQFIRLVPQATARGGRWCLECQPELVRLFEGTAGIERIIPYGQALPDFDLQLPLQGLPHALKLRVETIPRRVPYLHPPEDRVGYWSSRLAEHARPRVGLVWAGSRAVGDVRSRSIDIYAPLADVGGVHFFNLQKGKDSAQPPPRGLTLIDYTAELTDFAETAAFMESLDLIISVDTSAAHLAGAIGRPVWVVIPFKCDFRWLGGRTDSPWYPTMRLFREPKPGDTGAPVSQITDALRAFKPC